MRQQTPEIMAIAAALAPFLLLLAAAHRLHMVVAAAANDFQQVDVRELDFGMTNTQRRVPPEHMQYAVDATNGKDDPAGNTLALRLLHRDSVSGERFPTHRHRIDALINRDLNRVAALSRRMNVSSHRQRRHAAAGRHRDYKAEDFGSEVVSGLEQGSGEYFVRIGVGSPPRSQYMVIDSGSDVVWVQCQPCAQCYSQADPVFDPSESASFSGVPCGSAICGLLDRHAGCTPRDGRCRYEVSYGDGSYTKGTLALETLTFGTTAVRNVAMGCGHRNRGLFVGAAGLLGLGSGPISFTGQLGGQVGGAFGYCLVSRGVQSYGALVFGRAAAIPTGAAWVPLLRNSRAPSFYYIGLVGLGVGGVQLPVPEDVFRVSDLDAGGMVVDTGTAVTRLPSAAYQVLRDAFVASTVGLPRASRMSIFDTCFGLLGFDSVRVPTVSFYFAGGTVLTLPARNFLIPVDDMGTYCFAFAESDNGMSIMGNIQQEGIQITFDSASGFVGFGPYTC